MGIFGFLFISNQVEIAKLQKGVLCVSFRLFLDCRPTSTKWSSHSSHVEKRSLSLLATEV